MQIFNKLQDGLAQVLTVIDTGSMSEAVDMPYLLIPVFRTERNLFRINHIQGKVYVIFKHKPSRPSNQETLPTYENISPVKYIVNSQNTTVQQKCFTFIQTFMQIDQHLSVLFHTCFWKLCRRTPTQIRPLSFTKPESRVVCFISMIVKECKIL